MELNDARRKRAVNMVWTAADRYDFEPQYLFFHGNGEPDLYLNTLEGLAYSCMDEEILIPFLRGLEFGRDPDKFRALAQLVLEQAIFERKKEERPGASGTEERIRQSPSDRISCAGPLPGT